MATAVKEISDLLNTGLDEESLKVCVQLLEAGVNPEALAAVVRELRRETAALRVSGHQPPYSVGGGWVGMIFISLLLRKLKKPVDNI